ncbi:MAG: MBL fold metallo-hydrolase [Anaerolineales bacterium]|nr:MBL fold metallo-hydrolase [Anaerolineales bacterium]
MPLPPYLHCLTLPTPFPVGPVNVYLAEGEALTLIDTGPKADLTRTALLAGLAALGYKPAALRQIVLTHHHVDHIGLAGELATASGAAVITHPQTAPWLANYDDQRLRQEPFYRNLWVEAGAPDDILAAMKTASDSAAHWTDGAAATQLVDEGDTLTLGNEPWQVFHTPGHAGSLICLWEPNTRTLLANDHLLRDISSNAIVEPPPNRHGPRPRRLLDYLHHMRRMAALNPAVALPGHGEPVREVAALVARRARFHHRRAQKILGIVSEAPRTLWELTQPLFPRLTRPLDFFLAMSEVLGHLDLLEADGLVAPRPAGSVVRWTRVAAALDYTISHDPATA